MQITAGSLTGNFGKSATYWAERMLGEGLVHILATDAHDMLRRRPELARGRDRAAQLVGAAEAAHLVWTRPLGILADLAPNEMVLPPARAGYPDAANVGLARPVAGSDNGDERNMRGVAGTVRDLGRRLRGLVA